VAAEPEPRPNAPLAEALDAELDRVERVILRVWQMLGSAGVLASIALALLVSFDLGIACALTAALYLAWYAVLGIRHERGPASPALRFVTDLVEGTIPWTFLTVMAFAQGVEYALASWVPPMLFCGLILSHALRLRIRAPIVVSIGGGILFPVLYVVLMETRGPEHPSMLVFEPPVQISRSISLVVIGCVAALGSRFLRRAIVRAEGVVRAKDLFGKYRLLRRVARGGMGEIFEAVYCPEGGFERRVAIKRVHEHLAAEARFVELFRAEAELCSRLAHPSCVQVMDFGRVGDTYFLAMEYVDGITLARFISACAASSLRVPDHVAGAITRHLLAGLHHAHAIARGADGRPLRIIHRDLCPQNVLMSRNGEVKITDFGVARALRDAESSHTRTVVGHTAYMAPEQAQAAALDPKADLFSVGVIVWELLATRRLFYRSTEAATLKALLDEPVRPITSIRRDIDPAWEPFIARALARDPADRFASADEMSRALDGITSSFSEASERELAELVARFADAEESAPREAPNEKVTPNARRSDPASDDASDPLRAAPRAAERT
jgi:serine/threonine protein kinase